MNKTQFKAKKKKDFSLDDYEPDFTGEFDSEEDAQKFIDKNIEDLSKYQEFLAAHEKYGLLIIFQGMDVAGKDPIIKHIMSNVDPQGCETKSFNAPTEKERRHDYLWRVFKALPARGQIGIFNRSYYEHVTVERVHREKLDKWTLPDEAKGKDIWKRLFKEINNFEEYLTNNGIHILKFYLHMSKEKQRERLLERIENDDKKHEFAPDDMEDHEKWDEFIKAYEDAIANTTTKYAPWYVIPDEHRWFAKAAVSKIIIDKLKTFHSDYPEIDEKLEKEIKKAKRKLKKEAGKK